MKIKNERGITIVALVVTIAILLILAGVTVGALFGENGIVTKAQDAADQMNAAAAQEQQDMDELLGYLDGTYVPGSSVSGEKVNLLDYTTLSFQSFVGKYAKQSVDYLKLYVRVENSTNPDEYVIFDVGSDWSKEKINGKKNDPNNLFLIDNTTNVQMLRVLENDRAYASDNTTMNPEVINAFTDVKVTCRVKKGVAYKIIVKMQGARIDNSSNILVREQEIYSGNTVTMGDDTPGIRISKTSASYRGIYDLNGDGATDGQDKGYLNTIISGTRGTMSHYTISRNGSNETVVPMYDDELNAINPDYIGFDLNRDGVIDSADLNIIGLLNVGLY